MTTIDYAPHGVDLLAIRVGSTLERWGHERALRRAPHADPAYERTARLEAEAARAQRDALLLRIR